MNKKVIISVVVIAALAAGGLYLRTRNAIPTPPIQTTQDLVKESTEWAKAIQSGKPTRCLMTRGEEKMEYYVEGKKMRADITTSIPDAKTGTPTASLSHMINDGTYLYMWSEGQTQGSKMSLLVPSPSAVEKAPSQPQNPSTPNFEDESGYDSLKNEGYAIDCKSVSANPSLLAPPTTVTFIDPNEMMKKVAPTDGSASIDMKQLEEMAKQYQE